MYAWTRNYYAIDQDGNEYCFESKKSRDSAVMTFELQPMLAKKCSSRLRATKISDMQYRRIRSLCLFLDDFGAKKIKEVMDDD